MTADKAIELNKESIQSLAKNKFQDHADAVKMGNEALLRINRQRGLTIPYIQPPLPGEDMV